MTTRRELLIVGASLGLLASRAGAQRPPAKVGFLTLAATLEPYWTLFRAALRDLGYVEGKSVHFELRSAERADRLPQLAAELVRLNVDIIATVQGGPAEAAKQATTRIPIVLSPVGDAVAMGLVTSLGRPGGNITGVSVTLGEAGAKTLELMRDILPGMRRVAVLIDVATPIGRPFLEHLQNAGKALALEVQPIIIKGVQDVSSALPLLAKGRPDAAIVQPSLGPTAVDLVLKQRIAPGAPNTGLAEPGCLITYAADIRDFCRISAGYVDRILKGSKPADLPIQQPTKFETVLNLKTARLLGITVTQSVLARVDKVIE